jgi:hypothetical protein
LKHGDAKIKSWHDGWGDEAKLEPGSGPVSQTVPTQAL